MSKVRNIKDLAELAGVSTGTVSRALAGSELISAKTRERIRALADEHGFRPNIMARNLRIQRTGAIGVLIPLGHETGMPVSYPFFLSMLGHLADRLTEHGYDLLLSRIIPKGPDWLERVADSGRVDGLIVIGQSDQSDVLDRLAARYRPLMVWGGHAEGQTHCTVGSDNRKGGDMAASHLIERGCRRIAFLGDPRALEIAQRLDGCRDALRRAGLEDMSAVQPVRMTGEQARADIASLFAAGERPDGLVAASDVIAMSALNVLAEMGLSVPGDVRVIGFDGLAMGEQTVPRLSTVSQDMVRGAECLVDMLLRRISGEEMPSVMLEPRLVVRLSS